MMSKGNMELPREDQKAPFQFIMGCRMRRFKELDEEVLARGGRFHEVSENLKVKEVVVDGLHYVVCLNEEERLRDAACRPSSPSLRRNSMAIGPRASSVTYFLLEDKDKKTLEIWVRSSKTEQRIALRARTILAAAKGMSTRTIAREQKVRPATVSKLRTRFAPTLLTRKSLPRKRESRND